MEQGLGTFPDGKTTGDQVRLEVIAEFPIAQGAERRCLRRRGFGLLSLHYIVDIKLCSEFNLAQFSCPRNAHIFKGVDGGSNTVQGGAGERQTAFS